MKTTILKNKIWLDHADPPYNTNTTYYPGASIDSPLTICYTHAAMKKDIHPQTNPVIFVDTSCGAEFVTTSTLKSEETKDIDGVSHYIIRTEVSSASHPFYTGKQVLLDTARRIEKFQEKMGKQAAAAETRKGKKAKKASRTTKQTDEDNTTVTPTVTTDDTTTKTEA
jgi:large subunit ribosomal protein L31